MRHPHTDATYRVIPFGDNAFAVEVSIPDTNPTTVSPFATEGDAEAWIAEHRRRVEAQPNLGGRIYRRSAPQPKR